jgi:regulator of protease activity HflC (stomatin/prohibitin superfamily)
MSENVGAAIIITGVIFFVMFVIGLGMWGCPQYHVWERELSGKAELHKAEWNRQILIEEAKAKKESAEQLAEAEIIRAKGVAEANKIIGESLKGNDAYLRYLWIQGLQDGSSEIIYVPTEAQLPILEATRKLQKRGE